MTRFAVIGTNFITDWFLEAAALCPDFNLAAIYSRQMDTAKAFSQKHPAPLLFDDLSDLAACDQVDAVYIASPNAFHAPQAIRMLEGGKHVLIEKPVASNTKELMAIESAARANGKVWMEAMRPVFTPAFSALKEALCEIGPIRHVTVSNCQYSSRYDKFKAGKIENAFRPELSNSSLMDIGVYCVHPIVRLFGAPKAVHASSLFLSNGFEGQGALILDYDGMQAEIVYSKICDSTLPSQIIGEKGVITIERFNSMTGITLTMRDGTERLIAGEGHPHNMIYELSAFLSAIRGERGLGAEHQGSRDAIGIIEEARRQTGVIFPADAER